MLNGVVLSYIQNNDIKNTIAIPYTKNGFKIMLQIIDANIGVNYLTKKFQFNLK